MGNAKYLSVISDRIAALDDPLKQQYAYRELSHKYKVHQDTFITIDNGFGVVGDTIVTYSGSAKKLVIPAFVQGHPIKRVGGAVFYNNTNLVHLDIEEGIEEIGELAFSKCKHLKFVTLPSTMISIENKAFPSNQELKKLEITLKLDGEQFEHLLIGGIVLSDKKILIDQKVLRTEKIEQRFQLTDVIEKAPAVLLPEMKNIFYRSYGNWEVMNFENTPPIEEEETGIFYMIKNPVNINVTNEAEIKNDRNLRYRKSRLQDVDKVRLALIDKSEIKRDGRIYYVKLQIITTIAFFQSIQPVVVDSKQYFVYRREYLTSDERRPFLRDDAYVYTDTYKLNEGREKEVVWNKYRFLAMLE